MHTLWLLRLFVCISILLLSSSKLSSDDDDEDKPKYKDTDLHKAARDNNIKNAKYILKKDKSDLNGLGNDGRTPLFEAVLAGSIDVFKYLVQEGADTSIRNAQDFSLLDAAGFQGRAEIAKLLIDMGFNPVEFNKDGFLPYHRAGWGSEKRYTDTIRVFLEAGVPRSIRSKDGVTAFKTSPNGDTKDLIRNWVKKKYRPDSEL
jgi:ankyrin repeat protein